MPLASGFRGRILETTVRKIPGADPRMVERRRTYQASASSHSPSRRWPAPSGPYLARNRAMFVTQPIGTAAAGPEARSSPERAASTSSARRSLSPSTRTVVAQIRLVWRPRLLPGVGEDEREGQRIIQGFDGDGVLGAARKILIEHAGGVLLGAAGHRGGARS